jgi:hypothetical protein
MWGYIHLRSQLFPSLMRTQVVTAQPETAIGDVVHFAFVSYVSWVAVSAVEFREFFKREFSFAQNMSPTSYKRKVGCPALSL